MWNYYLPTQLSPFPPNYSIRSIPTPFSLLIDLIYDNSMLAVEFGPEDGISEDEFKVSIENAFSNSKF